jgi:hypothetical protein
MKKHVLLVAVALLGACHHGGGGGSSTNPSLGPTMGNFSSFSAVQPGQTATLPGTSTVLTGTVSAATVTPTTPGAFDAAGTRATMTYDSTRTLTAITATTPAGSITFNKAAGDTFNCNGGVCGLTNVAGTAAMIVIDPISLPAGFNYQSFGVWDRVTAGTSFDAGVFSVGAPTPGSAVPTTGTANFVGLANGFFVDSATHNAFFTTANMNASANFAAQTIAFSTTNTLTVSTANPSSVGNANAGLNLTGNFSYPAGTNFFLGTVTSANGMSGSGAGRFYGPAAQEIGGTYNLSGTAGSMIGSFGGKQ